MKLWKKPAIFIDRDGTLVEEVNYLSRLEDLIIFPYARDAVRSLKLNGFLTVVVTNQSGIGRGIYTESAMNEIHRSIQEYTGHLFDGFYYCPHLPNENCACRKPATGMITAACNDLDIDLKRSWMIGDKSIDIETAFNAGIGSAMVMTGYGREHLAKLKKEPDVIAEDFGKAVEAILRLHSSK